VVVEFALLILAAYLLGSVPAAYLAAKWSRGIDIRRVGSGNVGASNLLISTSKWLGGLVALFDVGKGAAMVWVAQLLGLGIAQQVTVGLAAIIGHNWSIFLRFGGGRGILATLGVIIILVPWLSPVALIIALLFVPFRQLALGVLISLISLPIFGWFLSQPLGINERLPITLGFLFALLIAVFKRLVAPRTSVTASVPTRQLFVNRLLFDRDIRDREAWIQRAPPEVSSAEQPSSQQKKQGKG